MILDLKIDATEDDEKCTGKVYKASVQKFPTSKGFGMSIRLNELKRKSCKCPNCLCIEDDINESMYHDGIIGLEEVENGELYTIRYTNITTDWESGIIDGWDLKLVKIEG